VETNPGPELGRRGPSGVETLDGGKKAGFGITGIEKTHAFHVEAFRIAA
jgi:hypothetical protein